MKKKRLLMLGTLSRVKKLRPFVKYVILGKWVFLPPKPKKILVCDGVQNPFKVYFKEKDLNILYRRGEEINIFILLSCLINFNLSTENYYKKYIQFAKPKIILSAITTFPMFYRLSKLTNVKTACIQWGVQSRLDGIFSDKYMTNPQNKKKFFIDYIFTHNKKVSKKFKTFCGGETVEIGSFYNNINKKFITKKKKEILFISTHKPYLVFEKAGYLGSKNKLLFKNDEHVIKCLSDFAHKNNLKLNVLGRAIGLVSHEKEYFNKIIRIKYKFIPNYKERDSNMITEQFKYVFTIDSTLALENIVKNGKSGFIFNRPNIFIERRHGAFQRIPYKGPFWTTTSANNKKEFNRVFNFVIKTSNKTWKKLRKKYNPELMVRDPGNKKFLKIVNKCLN